MKKKYKISLILLTTLFGVSMFAGVKQNQKINTAKAAPSLVIAYDFIGGGSSTKNNYDVGPVTSYINHGVSISGPGASPFTGWYSRHDLADATYIGSDMPFNSAPLTIDTWPSLKLDQLIRFNLEKIIFHGLEGGGEAGYDTRLGDLVIQSSPDEVNWTTKSSIPSSVWNNGAASLEALVDITPGSYFRFGLLINEFATANPPTYYGPLTTLKLTGLDFWGTWPPNCTGLTKSGTLAKTYYFHGEEFDPTGLTFTASLSDGTTADVTSAVTYSPSPLTFGTTTVTATYVCPVTDCTFNIDISGITVNPNSKVTYTVSAQNLLVASGLAPNGSSFTFESTSVDADGRRLGLGDHQLFSFQGFQNIKLRNIVFSVKTNGTSGAAGVRYSMGDDRMIKEFIPVSSLNSMSWVNNFPTNYVNKSLQFMNFFVHADNFDIRIFCSEGDVYVESITLIWLENVPTATPTNIKISPNISRKFSVNNPVQLYIIPEPAIACPDVTWSSSNPDDISVSSTGVITAHTPNAWASITATSTLDPSVTTEIFITSHDVRYNKVESVSVGLLGGEYTIGAMGSVAMTSYTDYSLYAKGIQGHIAEEVKEKTMTTDGGKLFSFRIFPGANAPTFDFRHDVDGDLDTGGFRPDLFYYTVDISNINYGLGLNEYMENGRGTWSINFDANGNAIISTVRDNTTYYIRYRDDINMFVKSSSPTAFSDVQLFKNENCSMYDEAFTFASEVNHGMGRAAEGNCPAAFEYLESYYDLLSPEAKNYFDTSDDIGILDARERYYYLQAWVAQNQGAPLYKSMENSTILIAIIFIPLIGITTIGLYYLATKKRRLN